MVDPARFDRVRIVQDRSVDADKDLPDGEAGTNVTIDCWSPPMTACSRCRARWATTLRRRSSLAQTVSSVEGVSDLLYLQVMTGVWQATGREGLCAGWTITPVGGSGKVPTFVALLGSQTRMNIATLIDFQEKDRQAIENIWRRKLVQKKQVLTYADFVDAREADVEDVVGTAFYLELVNAEYAAALGEPVAEQDLKSKHPRITVRLEEHFAENPLSGGSDVQSLPSGSLPSGEGWRLNGAAGRSGPLRTDMQRGQ